MRARFSEDAEDAVEILSDRRACSSARGVGSVHDAPARSGAVGPGGANAWAFEKLPRGQRAKVREYQVRSKEKTAMKTALLGLIVAVAVGAGVLQAGTSRTEVSVAGTWRMAVDSPHGAMDMG